MGTTFAETVNQEMQLQKQHSDILKLFIKNNRKQIAQKIQERFPVNIPPGLKFQLTKKLLDNPDKWPKELGGVIENGFTDFVKSFPKKMPGVVKKSHISVLEEEQVSK